MTWLFVQRVGSWLSACRRWKATCGKELFKSFASSHARAVKTKVARPAGSRSRLLVNFLYMLE